MAYGHVWALLPRCVNHPDKQGVVKAPDGELLCGPCSMPDEIPLTPKEVTW